MPRQVFHLQLETLTTTTVLLGEQAVLAVSQAIQAFVEGDMALATRVVDEDAGINRLERQILDDSTLLLTLQAPVASDLRRILGISRVASHLERIGDYARDIARETLRLASVPSLSAHGDLQLLIDAVAAMLRDGLRSFADVDASLARSVCLMDDGVDSAYGALFRDLLDEMVSDAMITGRATHTLFAAHDLERIGDHMANICETVIYMATGQTVELN